jgi:phenylacetate-coenzyme A ligase PaaK-like adenylate-forming protein
MFFKLQIFWFFLDLKLKKWLYRNKPEVLQGIRLKRFYRTLKKSPFYNSYLHPGSELKDFPIMNKATFMENFDSINTCNIKLSEAMQIAVKGEADRNFDQMIGKITVGLSTGTSGNRGVFLASRAERAR